MTKIFSAIRICLILGLFLLFPGKALALAKFNTSYQITYRVGDTGKTHVSFVINQRNNLSVVYATEYSINLNETKIENISVKDEGTFVKTDIIKTLNQTSITFPFANKIVGKDKNHTFTIDYDTADIATKFGSTWQIDIPRLEQDENVSEQTVILVVPTGFSTPVYIDPKPDLISGNIYYFNGQKISHKPISAIFGKTQFYQGRLIYHLSNSESQTIRTEIALPPDTSYQTVYFRNISPPPITVNADGDRNFLAKFVLEPKQKLEVTVDFIVKLDFSPRSTLVQPLDKYLIPQPIWNYDNSIFDVPEIKALTSPKSIYDFVSDKLKYDYSKLNRQKPVRTPAAESLINFQSAICTDFTDTFVSIARKAGIPARELEGFAISENPDLKPLSLTQDVLHAWPEYFDRAKATWIQVDPTWANTTRGIDYFNKLDFNHLVFVIHGLNPEYPIPAGGYKNGEKTKSITIEPIEALVFPQATLSAEFVTQKGNDLVFKIENHSGVSVVAKAKINGNDYLETTEQVLDLIPFSETTLYAKAKKQPFVSKNDLKVIIYLNGTPHETLATVGATSTPLIILAGVGGFLGFVALLTWGLHLRRQKQKTSLYR